MPFLKVKDSLNVLDVLGLTFNLLSEGEFWCVLALLLAFPVWGVSVFSGVCFLSDVLIIVYLFFLNCEDTNIKCSIAI